MDDELAQLYKDKLIIAEEPKPVVKKKRKKKKELELENLYTRELQYYDYDIVNEVKIYNGVIHTDKEEILANIELFKRMSPANLFTPLIGCTLTCTGELSNINFSESTLIPTLDVPPEEYLDIIQVGCNYGEIFVFPHALVKHDIAYIIKCIYRTTVKIGCPCQPPMDITQIRAAVDIVNDSAADFATLFNKYIRNNIKTDSKFPKNRISRIIKNFVLIQNYQYHEVDDINEVYNVIEAYIISNADVKFCNTHIHNIKAVVKIFDEYELACDCDHQYSNIIKKDLTKKVKSSTRGRKPKDKETKKRKTQGSGAYFSSQITFYIFNHHNDKVTKLKVFRNGKFQIPGGLMPNMSDLIDAIKTLRLYFNHILYPDADEPKVDIIYAISVMRNYTSRIINTVADARTIMLQKLEDIFCEEKAMQTNVNKSQYVELFDELPQYIQHKVYNYCNTSFYPISEISFNSERYPGLLVKFLKPIPGNPTKKITVKILSSGKINFDGCTSELEVTEIYYWLQYIFNKYWSEIIYDSTEQVDEVVSDDSQDGYESIYDA
jgi:TATA-box binding protein (TBP) (component of TFIID and TFIIIB)